MIEEWRYDAACLGRAPMFDARIEDESDADQAARQAAAKRICDYQCPVKAECLDDVDYKRDDGVRGGIVLVTLKEVASYGVVEGVRRSPRSDRKAS